MYILSIVGDLCDDDIDNDGIANTIDNCIYVSNSNQEDTNGNAVGDVCESDTDGDGIDDNSDTCPHNPSRQSTSFSSYTSVILDPSSTSDLPNWLVKSDGSEVEQTVSTDLPVMLIGNDLFNPFPNKPWFLRVCSTGLLKTLWEKEKLLATSNFSFSHSVFLSF